MSEENSKIDESSIPENIENKSLDKNVKYDESDIKTLKGIHGVRKRPSMYIGDTDRVGLHHLIFEIADNSVDEALAGYCDQITIEKFDGNIIEITDNGRGIPTGIHPEEGISAATLIFTELHAGGKFGGGGYKVSGGLHGVGATVTNALSNFLEVRIKRDGKLFFQRFEKGIQVDELKVIAELDDPSETGTSIRFSPDPTMFPEALEEKGGIELSLDFINERVRRTSYLTPKLRLTLMENGSLVKEYYSENGIIDYVKDIGESLYKSEPVFDESKNEEMFTSDIKYFEGSGTYINSFDNSKFNTDVEIAFVYQNKYFDNSILSFANNIFTVDGGKHVLGFENGILKAINEYNVKELKSQEMFIKEDVLEGLNVVISFKTEEPKFSDQTKRKLSTGAAQSLCYQETKAFIENLLETDPDYAKFIISKCRYAKEMREQVDKKRLEVEKKISVGSVGGTPAKLSDCSIKTREGTEIFLVEGDSAGGSAKMGRDRKNQAILPLKGKILNAFKNTPAKVEDSEEVKNLKNALKTGVGEDFDIEKLRYEKIIIMCDADVDGAHIETLVLSYFIKKMPELIKNGCVYLAQPPLYVLRSKSGGAKLNLTYIDSEEELLEHYVDGALPSNLIKQRFKGLGEMNPDQLWETTMNPETRRLLRVCLTEDDEVETYQVFEDLMGKKVEPRRDFIFKNAINIKI